MQIRLGEHDTSNKDGHEVDMDIAPNGMIMHPHYNENTMDNDIAIIKLASPVAYTDKIQPVCINRQDDLTGITISTEAAKKTHKQPKLRINAISQYTYKTAVAQRPTSLVLVQLDSVSARRCQLLHTAG